MYVDRRCQRAAYRKTRGFSLIDALVAASLVVGIGAMSLPSFLSTTVVNRSIERAGYARDAARIVIENIRDYGTSNLVDGTYPLTKYGAVGPLADLPNVTGFITVTTTSASIRKVVIRVQWTSGVRQGRLRTYNLVTLLTPGGVSP